MKRDFVMRMSLEERDTVAHALQHMARIAVETCPTLATAIAQVEGINALLAQIKIEPCAVPEE